MSLITFRRTGFDGLVVLFLLTAGMGVWTAYDGEAAWVKFWLLAAGVLVFYALAWQPGENLKAVVWLGAGLNAALAAYFLLTHDWSFQPADIGLLNRLGLAWMKIRPALPLEASHPNIIGGILAALLPLNALAALQAHGRRSRTFSWLLGGLACLGLLMTSSRAAWAALALAVLCVAALEVYRRLPSQRLRIAFVVGLLLLALATITVVSASPGQAQRLVNALPGADSSHSRWELAQNTWFLAGDFFFTGGGLDSFAGLYSQYVLYIPVMKFQYAHNLYLDVALEQGIFGLLALLGILAGSAWPLLAVQGARRPVAIAALAGLSVMALHGLVDDAFYGMRGTPLLLALAGFAVAAAHSQTARQPSEDAPPASPQGRTRRGRLGLVFCLLALAAAGLLFWKPLLAAWYANLGAVSMARVQLAGWQAGQINQNLDAVAPPDAAARFEQTLALYPANLTALYRLGMISYQRRDYPAASEYLEAVFVQQSAHHGVRKVSSYALAWQGRLDEAAERLAGVSEAQSEMVTFTWWWGTQNRPDLVDAATKLAEMLK